jgi:hypothetical protein
MRKAVVIFSALCIGTALVGCTKSNTHSAEKTTPITVTKVPGPVIIKPAVEATWELKLSSVCPESTEAKNCVGKYGFSVDQDGKYKVGPGPNKELRTGQLTEEEKAAVKALFDTLLTSSTAEAENHDSTEEGNNSDSSEVITLSQVSDHSESSNANATERTLVKKEGTDLTLLTQSADVAKQTYTLVHQLAENYYPLPFPEPCVDGANLAKTFFTSMLDCKVDSDCAYIDSEYKAFVPEASTLITTDSCSLVPTLYVGNASLIQTNKEALNTYTTDLETGCPAHFTRENCTPMQFQANNAVPACVAGACQLKASQ